MSVKISYFPQNAGSNSLSRQFIGVATLCETITVPGTGTAVTADTLAVLVSTESSAVNAAHGTTPDAALTTGTWPVSTAGYAIPPLVQVPVWLKAGDKINIKTYS